VIEVARFSPHGERHMINTELSALGRGRMRLTEFDALDRGANGASARQQKLAITDYDDP
jgi:hypothetical protein